MADDAPTLPEPSSRSSYAGLIAGVLGFVALGAMIVWTLGQPTGKPRRMPIPEQAQIQEVSRFVGARACRECHEGIYMQHARSGHARTLHPAADRLIARELDGQTVPDPEIPGVTWTYALNGDEFSATRDDGKTRERELIEWAFGSGDHAITFVSMVDTNPRHPKAREHRQTWYNHTQSLGVTPGQEAGNHNPGVTPEGRLLDNDRTFKCFACHVSRTSDQGFDRLDVATMTPGVSCERCHGAGDEHIAAARRGEADLSMINGHEGGPLGWTAESQLMMCGVCHRHPSQARAGQIQEEDLKLVRFQPVGLMQSACYRKSEGRLTCLTCHDVHTRTSKDTLAYEATCLSCHGESPGQTHCVQTPEPTTGCVSCHMRKEDAGQAVLFTDHWIR